MTCRVDSCVSPVRVKKHQLCTTHYHRWKRHGDTSVVLHKPRTEPTCSVDGCEKPNHATGLCQRHYRRQYLYGSPLGRSAKYGGVQCLECGVPIEIPADQIGWPPLHCSDRCRSTRWSERYEARGFDCRKIEGRAKVEVFERDGWICGICHGPVDPELIWPNRMMATIDHIVPVVQGGTHTLANVRLAHLSCNTRRRDENR